MKFYISKLYIINKTILTKSTSTAFVLLTRLYKSNSFRNRRFYKLFSRLSVSKRFGINDNNNAGYNSKSVIKCE